MTRIANLRDLLGNLFGCSCSYFISNSKYFFNKSSIINSRWHPWCVDVSTTRGRICGIKDMSPCSATFPFPRLPLGSLLSQIFFLPTPIFSPNAEPGPRLAKVMHCTEWTRDHLNLLFGPRPNRVIEFAWFSLRSRRKKGRERGREKSAKEGKGKGAPALRAGVFVIRPPFSQLIR